jgi:hypothetical protein
LALKTSNAVLAQIVVHADAVMAHARASVQSSVNRASHAHPVSRVKAEMMAAPMAVTAVAPPLQWAAKNPANAMHQRAQRVKIDPWAMRQHAKIVALVANEANAVIAQSRVMNPVEKAVVSAAMIAVASVVTPWQLRALKAKPMATWAATSGLKRRHVLTLCRKTKPHRPIQTTRLNLTKTANKANAKNAAAVTATVVTAANAAMTVLSNVAKLKTAN